MESCRTHVTSCEIADYLPRSFGKNLFSASSFLKSYQDLFKNRFSGQLVQCFLKNVFKSASSIMAFHSEAIIELALLVFLRRTYSFKNLFEQLIFRGCQQLKLSLFLTRFATISFLLGTPYSSLLWLEFSDCCFQIRLEISIKKLDFCTHAIGSQFFVTVDSCNFYCWSIDFVKSSILSILW